ncbi:phosphotransferase enzyme family protein [Streptomyces sp. NPDC059063]|uniref:phosphotransferase enzyme family protein n=1 Tax=unclassified Streptomyces TaxID=2593676 RepID=UPI0036A9933E
MTDERTPPGDDRTALSGTPEDTHAPDDTRVHDDARVRAWVREDFGVALDRLDPVTDGADEAAWLWRGTGADGRRYAVKLSKGGSAAGLVVTARLAEHGLPGVAGPVRTRRGGLWSARDGGRLTLVPWVSDAPALDGAMGAEHWAAYGELLARVHATPVTDELAGALPREDYTHERLASFVRDVDRRLRRDLPPGADALHRAVAAEWRAATDRAGELLDRAAALGRALRARPAAPMVVCHGDPHLGNVLLGGPGRVWLIDWDDAVLAPRERDLMFVMGGVLYFALVGPREQGWFFDAYGAVATPDPDRLAYCRAIRALEDLALPAAQVADADRWSEAERVEALAVVRGVLSPTGLVEQALS